MLKLRDRIYGELELPEEAWKLVHSCPVLLRLREIRMANIPFFTYPSFANVDRFEHSLGVAHLAWRWARRNCLSDDKALALTLAALYHDGATPAFGHLFEEYLFRFGWNHENALVLLLLGDPELAGREQVQVFLGEHCKLTDVLSRSPLGRLVTPSSVADLAGGSGELGRLIKGDLDLDNIDNVLRASSAMGLMDLRGAPHPYDVADALVWESGEVRLRPDRSSAVAAWSEVRHLLYEHILKNSLEFRSQSALKWAIAVCARGDKALQTIQGWTLTDPQLMFDHLRRNPFAALLVDRVRKCRPPELLFSAWIDDLSPLLGRNGGDLLIALRTCLDERTGMKVYVNYYLDKRHRDVRMPLSQERTLFQDTFLSGEIPTGPQRSGVLGVVGVSEAEYTGALGTVGAVPAAGARNRSFSVSDFRRVLESAFSQEVQAVSQGWIGALAAREQLALFEAPVDVD